MLRKCYKRKKLPVMMHSQSVFVPFRSCVFSPKIMFTFRTNKLTQHKNIWIYDSFITEYMQPLSQRKWPDIFLVMFVFM